MARPELDPFAPLYHQIKTHLIEEIRAGHLRPGDRVSSERELSERFGVSRMTARQALVQLELEGRVVRVQGKGSFVAFPKIEQPLMSITGFTEDMRRRGLEPATRVLSAAEVPAEGRVATALRCREGTPIYRLERLRLADGEPLALEVSHLLAESCPGLLSLDLEGRSLYELLRTRYGRRLLRATQTLEAVPAEGPLAEALHVRTGTPLMYMERLVHDQNDQPVELVLSHYRGDRYRFIAELRAQEGE
ncbi:MAG: GntR family transcriptional regulator [Symbiobacterium sp.]|uniref:GntR family transcriptional regulator n=1 Tax=Symbiobacterium sp. TaxID=1971213 RepID=UPI0034639D8C